MAFRKGTVDPFGNAYNLAVVCCAREFASQFFREFPSKWIGSTSVEKELIELSKAAAVHYEEVAESLRGLRNLFPFPQGGEPNDPVNVERAVSLLEEAKAAEVQGVQILQKMYESVI